MSQSDQLRARVVELLEAGFGGSGVPGEARVLEPIAVVDPYVDRVHSWFVPVATGERLAGFAELTPELEPLRYSSFQRGSGVASELPDTADWVDPGEILQRARGLSRPDERLDEPVLTYDRDPARLAWRVKATDSRGTSRWLYVVGSYAYEGPDEPPEPMTGGGPP